MTRRRVAIVGVVLAVAVTAAVVGQVTAASPSPTPVARGASSLVTIQQRTITSQQQVDGTLGFAGGATLLQPVGTAPDAVAEAEGKAWAAELTVERTRAALYAADETTVAQAQADLAAAEQAWSTAQAAAADARAAALAFGPTSIYTAVPAIGQVITRGQALYSINAQPVPLLYGPVTPWRAFRAGMSAGPDVKELNQNLADLGYDGGLAASDVFSSRTAAAIAKLQRSLGLTPTGALLLGAAAFTPGAARVTSVTAKAGAAAQPGAAVVDVASTARQVTVKLDAGQQSQVHVGDAVVITLPDKKAVPATVTSVGTVAVASASSGPESGTTGPPTVDVVITPTDSAATGNLDAAPVQVAITTGTVDGALVVPVTALLAVSGGGYGVEVVSRSGVHHVEAVTLGLFDDADGVVQITGPNVHAGDHVEVASA